MVGNQGISLMVDLGLVDVRGEVGVSLDPAVYDLLKQRQRLGIPRWRHHRSADGYQTTVESALTTVHLIEPASQAMIGPAVSTHVCRGAPGVQSRVGVVFFHRLTGCRVVWELDTRDWCVEYP